MTGSQRIAIVTPTFLPYRGGMCVVAEQDAEDLAALGHEVDVWAPSGCGTGEVGGYRVRSLRPWFRYGNAALVPGTFGACSDYDLTVLHYPFFGGAEPVALARSFGRCRRLVVYYHMDVLGHGLVRAVAAVHGRLLRPWVLRSADRILVTSFDYARSSAVGPMFLETPELFRELPPSVDTERFCPGRKPEELVRRYGLDPNRPTAVFVGGLDQAHYFKGIGVLIRALALGALSKMQAVVVGGGELIAEYRALAERLGVAGRVTFTGPVSDEELPLHYRLGDVFAFPSLDRSEAFGIAALEAMSSGVPVVASDLPGVRTIVRPGQTGFLARPGSVSALAARIADVVADPRRRAVIAAAGREMAVAEYSDRRRIDKWQRIAAELFSDR
ncbi:MAG: glycosyltransferase family 4 protein [bacterium]